MLFRQWSSDPNLVIETPPNYDAAIPKGQWLPSSLGTHDPTEGFGINAGYGRVLIIH